MTHELYNPLTYENLMSGLAMHFQQVSKRPLRNASGPKAVVYGPGVYAIYYVGSLDVYEPIRDGKNPIYVGKAVPPGGRKGGGKPNTSYPALHKRLREHANSVQDAQNLSLDDFQYRSLAVEPVWITLAERFLIETHNPVWNLVLDGFGKHNSGRNRQGGKRSWWDTLHPGRDWAAREQATNTEKEARSRIQWFFREQEIVQEITL